MYTVFSRVQRFRLFSFPWMATLLLALTVRSSLARDRPVPVCASAGAGASQALYEAVQNDNEQERFLQDPGRPEGASLFG